MKNYHRILGVSEDAEPEEIKAAYRKLAKKYHPDSHPDDPNIKKKFQEISEAYEARVFNSFIMKKMLTGLIEPIFFCQKNCLIL